MSLTAALPDDVAAIALGSNLGDRQALLQQATQALAGVGEVLARSALYETDPVGPPQPAYLNAVVLLRTGLDPEALLARMLDIERSLGRVRAERWGPRTIDLDLLLLGARTHRSATLVLPHPELHRRAFVLQPLSDVAPEAQVPGQGRVRDLLQNQPESDRAGVRLVARSWAPGGR